MTQQDRKAIGVRKVVGETDGKYPCMMFPPCREDADWDLHFLGTHHFLCHEHLARAGGVIWDTLKEHFIHTKRQQKR